MMQRKKSCAPLGETEAPRARFVTRRSFLCFAPTSRLRGARGLAFLGKAKAAASVAFAYLFLLLLPGAQEAACGQPAALLSPEITQEDREEILSLLGITLSHVPLSVTEGSYYLDYFVDEYREGELVASNHFLGGDRLEQLKRFSLQSHLPTVSDSTEPLRMYAARRGDSLEVLKIKAGKMSWEQRLRLEPAEEYEWKPFLEEPLVPERKVPVLSLFAVWEQAQGEASLRRACLPDLPPEELGQLLSHYFVLSVRLVSELP